MEDSLIKANNYINNWAREKLLFEKSLINLPQEKISDLSNLVDAYKNNLFINAYREFVLKSTMESFDTTSIINSFYEANKENFLLKEPIFRVRYISFPLDNVVRKQITRRFKRYNVEDVRFLDSLSFQFSSYFLSDTIWLNEIEVGEQLNKLIRSKRSYF